MNNKTLKSILRIISTILGLFLLFEGLLIGYPLELSNPFLRVFCLIIYSVAISFLIFIVGRQIIYRLNDSFLTSVFERLIFLLILGYLGFGLSTIFSFGSKWTDVKIYRQNNKTIVKQSNRDNEFRLRRIIYEFTPKDRISIKWTDKK